MKDKDGYWTITGRSDDVINLAGKRIGPAEIESALVEHPVVREAAVIGIPDELKGERAIGFVIVHEQKSVSEAELISLCHTWLGKALVPAAVLVVHDLPKTRNAKVMRRAIKMAFSNQTTGDFSALENPETMDHIREKGHSFFNKQ
ncbi:AMP-binding enzyme [Bacillus piscicola]|uniref:AMP-binding enzyme n=1 Tax=Bacillus piscicola TaxID=1632684 RepID=UPI003083F3DD